MKGKRVDLGLFMDLMCVSGLRKVEAVECYNLIIARASEGTLGSYFNGKTSCLEHFRFGELFFRKSKNVYVSFVPSKLVFAIARSDPVGSGNSISKSLRDMGVHSRFSDIREAHGTLMTKFLNVTEINFLHGRVSSGVFEQHYFNPALISDLRDRVFKGVRKILRKVRGGAKATPRLNPRGY